MPEQVVRELRGLRNKRDLRAQMIELAAAIEPGATGCLKIVAPVIAANSVRREWARLLPVLVPTVRERLQLVIHESPRKAEAPGTLRAESRVRLSSPNYRFEVLRLLLDATLRGSDNLSLQELLRKIGASQTPIRAALHDLKRAGLLLSSKSIRQSRVAPEDLSVELLAKVVALPQMLRFRFERGAHIKRPATLLERVERLLQPGAPQGWKQVALSGVPVAQLDVPRLDLMGLPRLDLVIQVGRETATFDTGLLRQLDDGLELEPNVLAPAPVVVTIVRADEPLVRNMDHVRCAGNADVLLSLLDLGLRDQAIQYAKEVRR